MIGFVKPSSRRSAIDPQRTSFELLFFFPFFFLLWVVCCITENKVMHLEIWQYRVKELEDGLASLWEVEGELAKVASQPWPEPPDMMGGVLVYNPTKYNIKWSKYTTAAVGLVQSKWNNNNNNSIYHEEYYNKQALDDYNAKCRKKSKSPGGIQQTVATKTHDRRRIRRFSDPPIKPSLDLFQRILQSVQIIVSKVLLNNFQKYFFVLNFFSI
jgi:hypothetical protein